MKNFKIGITVVLLALISINKSLAQEIIKYDYIEVIVIQKMNNSGKIKRIKVENQNSLVKKNITRKEIESIKTTSDLLNYMNINNWEFIDRKAITEINNPIWMSYLFRKNK